MSESNYLALMEQLWTTNHIINQVANALDANETILDSITNGWGELLMSRLFDPNEEWKDIICDQFWDLICKDKTPSKDEFLKFYKENM